MKDLAVKDIKKGAREVENTAKETGRKLDGNESVSDKLGNAGDDIRHGLGNAGDEVRDALKKQEEMDQRRTYPEHQPR
jgi:hypothetical protein